MQSNPPDLLLDIPVDISLIIVSKWLGLKCLLNIDSAYISKSLASTTNLSVLMLDRVEEGQKERILAIGIVKAYFLELHWRPL